MRVARAVVHAAFPVLPLALILGAVVLLFGGVAEVQVWMINAILVIGLYIFVGNSGVMSFGHMAFVAIGAYGAAVLTIPTTTKQVVLPDLPTSLQNVHVSTLVAVLIAMAIAFIVAFVAAVPLMRLSGLAAGIATLALLVISNNFLLNYQPLAGSGTLTGVPTDATTGLIFVWTIVAMAIAYAFQRSKAGLRLRASRDDEVAARGVGVRVEADRRISFALSAAVAALGGALYGHYLGAFGANFFYFSATVLMIGMLVVGGKNSLTGAVTGAIALSALTRILDGWEAGDSVAGLALKLPGGMRDIAVAAIILLILIVRPAGLTGGRELTLPSGATLARLRARWSRGRGRLPRDLEPAVAAPPRAATRFGIEAEERWAYVQANVADGLVYVAGQVPRDEQGRPLPGGELEPRVELTLANLEKALAGVGARLEDLVYLQVHVAAAAAEGPRGAAELVRRRLAGVAAPATCVVAVANLNDPAYLIEISAVAAAAAQRKEKGMSTRPLQLGTPDEAALNRPSAVACGRLLFVSGQASIDDDGAALADASLPVHYRRAFERVLAVVAAAGGTPASVVSTHAFVTQPLDEETRPVIQALHEELFGEGADKPANTLVVVPRVSVDGALAEITAVAELSGA